jgi:hypothetical protein
MHDKCVAYPLYLKVNEKLENNRNIMRYINEILIILFH